MVYIIEHPTRGYLSQLSALSVKWSQDHREALTFRSITILKSHLDHIEHLFKEEGCVVKLLSPCQRYKPTRPQVKARAEITRMLFGHLPKRRRRKKGEPAEELYHSVVFKDGHQVLPYRDRTAKEVRTLIGLMGMKLMSIDAVGNCKRAHYINNEEQELVIMKGEEPKWN